MTEEKKTFEQRTLEIAENYYNLATRRLNEMNDRISNLERYRLDQMEDHILAMKESLKTLDPTVIDGIQQALSVMTNDTTRFQAAITQLIDWQKETEKKRKGFENKELLSLGISVRLFRALAMWNITDLNELWDTSPKHLYELRGMGLKTRFEMCKTLSDAGFPVAKWHKQHGITPPKLTYGKENGN